MQPSDIKRYTAPYIAHAIVAALLVVLAVSTIWFIPNLWEDRTASFSAIGGFATFYGVIFAVIEAFRTQSAAALAKEAAESSRRHVDNLYSLRDLAKCHVCITSAIEDIDKHNFVSTTALLRIHDLYSAQFKPLSQSADSPHRILIAEIESFASRPNQPLKPTPSKNLKATLVKLLSQVTNHSAQKTETEIK